MKKKKKEFKALCAENQLLKAEIEALRAEKAEIEAGLNAEIKAADSERRLAIALSEEKAEIEARHSRLLAAIEANEQQTHILAQERRKAYDSRPCCADGMVVDDSGGTVLCPVCKGRTFVISLTVPEAREIIESNGYVSRSVRDRVTYLWEERFPR
jgi:hypothetical protein